MLSVLTIEADSKESTFEEVPKAKPKASIPKKGKGQIFHKNSERTWGVLPNFLRPPPGFKGKSVFECIPKDKSWDDEAATGAIRTFKAVQQQRMNPMAKPKSEKLNATQKLQAKVEEVDERQRKLVSDYITQWKEKGDDLELNKPAEWGMIKQMFNPQVVNDKLFKKVVKFFKSRPADWFLRDEVRKRASGMMAIASGEREARRGKGVLGKIPEDKVDIGGRLLEKELILKRSAKILKKVKECVKSEGGAAAASSSSSAVEQDSDDE